MTASENRTTLGAAIDGIINSLSGLDQKAQMTAIKAACDHLGLGGISLSSPSAVAAATSFAAKPLETHPHSAAISDIRTLKETKQPNTINEMACIVAYYIEYLAPAAERKAQITSADVDKYFKQAGYPLPSAIKQVLQNARAAGYFDSVGGGEFKLNPVGYNLVAHTLPRTLETAQSKKPRKSKTAKTPPRTKK